MGKVTDKLRDMVNQLDKVKQLDKSGTERVRQVDQAMHREAQRLREQREKQARQSE